MGPWLLRGTVPALYPGQVSHPEHIYIFSDPLSPGESWYYWLEVEGTEDWLGPAGPLALPFRIVLTVLVR